MNLVKNNRIEWIDSIKGIAIILVVITHSYTLKPPIESTEVLYYFLKSIYIIHIPTFFFISGFLYKKGKTSREYAKNQIYHLLIPYFSLLILFLPFTIFVFPSYTAFFTTDSIFQDVIRYFSGRSIANMITGPLWFLPTLFFTQVIYNSLQRKCNLTIIHIIAGIMYIISFLIFYYRQNFWLPLYVHLSFAILPIFHIGYLIKYYNLKVNKTVLFICIVTTLFCLLYFTSNIINYIDNFYGIPVITLFCSITSFLTLREILLFIEKKLPSLSHFFSKIGESSLIIMAFHSIIILTFHKIITNSFILVVIATALSYAIYLIIKKYSFTRAVFMGNKADIQKLKNSLFNRSISKI